MFVKQEANPPKKGLLTVGVISSTMLQLLSRYACPFLTQLTCRLVLLTKRPIVVYDRKVTIAVPETLLAVRRLRRIG